MLVFAWEVTFYVLNYVHTSWLAYNVTVSVKTLLVSIQI